MNMRWILAIALLSVNASAFELYGFTQPKQITYRCDKSLKDTFVAEFAQWNGVCGGIFTLVEQDDDSAMWTVQLTNSIYPALGYFDYNYATQKVLIQIDPDSVLYTPGEDNAAAMLHEIGHALGLAHSEDAAAIMYPTIAPGRWATLSQDDINGIRTIYGLGAFDAGVESFDITVKGVGSKRAFTAPYNVQWDFGDGIAATGTMITHRFAVAGNYVVTASYLGVNKSVLLKIGHPKKAKKP